VDSVRLLTEGAVEVKGRMPWSSNATFLAELCLDGTVGLAVYKPERGERPLWDYPPGLWRREVAAYIVSETLDLGFVPETIERVDAPLGQGSLQRRPAPVAQLDQPVPVTRGAEPVDMSGQLVEITALDEFSGVHTNGQGNDRFDRGSGKCGRSRTAAARRTSASTSSSSM